MPAIVRSERWLRPVSLCCAVGGQRGYIFVNLRASWHSPFGHIYSSLIYSSMPEFVYRVLYPMTPKVTAVDLQAVITHTPLSLLSSSIFQLRFLERTAARLNSHHHSRVYGKKSYLQCWSAFAFAIVLNG